MELKPLRGIRYICAAGIAAIIAVGITGGSTVASAHGVDTCSHANPLTFTLGDAGSGSGPTNVGAGASIIPSCTTDVTVTMTLQNSEGQTVATSVARHAEVVAGQQSQVFEVQATGLPADTDCYTPTLMVAGGHSDPITIAMPELMACPQG
jgi:hypothetical protein